MSSRQVRRIACDHNECDRALTLQTDRLSDLRRHAQDSGWRVGVVGTNTKHPRSGPAPFLDFCPEHA